MNFLDGLKNKQFVMILPVRQYFDKMEDKICQPIEKIYDQIAGVSKNEELLKFLDDEKKVVYLYKIGGGGFADVDCYFDSSIN